MRKFGNEEKLGGRKPVEPVLQLHVVVVVATIDGQTSVHSDRRANFFTVIDGQTSSQ